MATNRFGDPIPQTSAPTSQDRQAPTTNRFGDNIERPSTPRAREAEDEGVLWEFGEGVASGLIGIGQGVGELVASGIDLVADTEYADAVTDAGEATRDYLGIDPTGFVGKGAEIVTQFVIPGVGVAGMVSKAGRAARAARGLTGPMTRSQRMGEAAKQLAAAGAVDAAVANEGTTTIGDFFDGGPTATNQEIGLSGREEALRRLGNKFKIGTEAALLGGVAQGALSALGVGASRAAQTETGQAVGRAVGQSQPVQAGRGLVNRTREYLQNAERRRVFGVRPGEAEMGKGEQFIADTLGALRYRSFMPEEIATERLLVQGKVQPYIRKAEATLNRLEQNIDTAIGKMGKEVDSEVERRMIFDNIEEYLTNPDAEMKKQFLSKLPSNIRGDVQRMRNQVTSLSEDVLNSNFLRDNNFVDKNSGRAVKDVINENINSYLRRRYRVFEDKSYTPTGEQLNIAAKEFQKDKRAVQQELTNMARGDTEGLFTDAELNRIGAQRVGAGDQQRIVIAGKVTDEAARLARDNFLNKYRIRNRSNAKLSGGRIAENRLDTGMFMDKKYMPKYQRELLGEIDDPREAYLGTVADLAQFKAVDEYFGNVKRMAEANSGFGKFFIDPQNLSPLQQKQLLDSGQYVQLGSGKGRSTLRGEVTDELDEAVDRSGWGSLHGYIVPERIYKDLTQTVLAEDDFGTELIRGVWSTFLRGKGISQYSKTVLSPVTQVRNFTTAAFFALNQGNVGRGMKGSLGDSAKLVYQNLRNLPDEDLLDELADMQNRGIIGTQTELREIQDMVNRGAGYSARDPKNITEAIGGEYGRKLADTKMAKSVGKGLRFAEKAYQSSDDFWKIYNYQFETNKLRNALRELTPQDQYKYLTKGQDLNPQMRREIIANPSKMEDLLKDRAAQIVRDTVPNYNKAPEAIKAARKLPVGNFITFPYEIFRTGGNTIRQAIEEMNPANPEAIRNIGRRRMAGAVGTMGVMPIAAANLGYAVSGVSREEMDAYQRSFSAPWEKNAVLIPIGRDEDGNLEYINFSTSNPYDSIVSMFNAAINEADESYRQGRSADEIALRAGFETLKDFFEPFLSQSIIAEALLDVTARGGKTSTGAQVYNPEDSVGDKLGKGFAHVLEGIMPNFVPASVTNLNPANMEFEPSRFARGVVGSVAPGLVNPTDKLGREREISEELFRVFTGITPMTFDPEFALRINAGRMQRAQTDAKRIFNSVLDDANLTPDRMIDAYRRANDRKRVIDEQYFQIIEDLRTLGMSTGQIRRLLKENKIGGADQILRGRFEPFTLSDDARGKMRRAGTLDIYRQTRGDIRSIYRDLRGTPLTRDEEPAPRPSAPQQQPSTTRFGDPVELNFNIPQPTPLPQPAPNRFGDPSQASVDPAALIPDPRTRELLNR